jgi:signal transduction histidine kinase/ligand-binding sensor domain-containing protein
VSPQVANRIAFRFILTCALSMWLSCALALDPALDVSQYGHTAWKIQDGFAGDVVNSIAQTTDGYLWLGTLSGLMRFDGVRIVPWQPPAGASIPDNRIRALLAARDGTLWIGTFAGLASWKQGKLTTYPRFDRTSIGSLIQDREGTVWVAANSETGLLCALRFGIAECHGEGGRFGAWVCSLFEDSKGALWMSVPNGVWRWKPGAPVFYPLPEAVAGSFQSLIEADGGAMLVVTRSRVWRIADDKVREFPIPDLPVREAAPRTLFRDRDGAIWIDTSEGLRHLHAGRWDAYTRLDGLSANEVIRFFEDREGNVWVMTPDGIDRFRALAAANYSVGQGVSGAGVSVLADQDGSTWISTTTGLYRWRDGQATGVIGPQPFGAGTGSLFQDHHGRVWVGSPHGTGYLDSGRLVPVTGVPKGYVDAIDEDSEGNLWIAHRDAGLLRLSPGLDVQPVPWKSIGQSGPADSVAIDPVNGGLWLGFWSGGVVHLVGGRVRASYSAADGLGKGRVAQVRVEADGTVLAATESGLSRIKAGQVATLDRRNGLLCDSVHWTIPDDDGAVWLYTQCGLVRIARSDLASWADAAEQGRAPQRIRAQVLDGSEGVRAFTNPGSWSPMAAKSRDGRLWFKCNDGVAVVDPRHLSLNKLPPPVHIEQVVADRKAYELSSQVRLPPLVRDLQIEYTALSLVAPERNMFRYKLEGHDRDWQSVRNRRQAFYNDLPPGSYQFRVVASNNSGVWNEQGSALDFSIAPAYWQTTWFRALCVSAILLVLWALYQLRLRQIAQAFNARLDERVAERTRIARDLHDTLLQSFQGLLLRFQTVHELLPQRPTDAKETLASAIDRTAQAITEGREAVQGLRASTVESNDLAMALTSLGEELAAEPGTDTSSGLRVQVEGTARTLHPIVRDEIFRIAGEALRNAFRHAGAKQIEVELRYDERQLRLRVRDDGKGIDLKILTADGRPGHFGLPGMRERAELVGGKLTVWSAPESGTEIELSIAAARAYAESGAPRRAWFGEKPAEKGSQSAS